ncbi:thiol:disulfide interchange protein [Candidatus Symbiothrix dinenymphae]|nr:thiol:disulfide interchange protein [Candidatus Symbiothrix dinenymphae]
MKKIILVVAVLLTGGSGFAKSKYAEITGTIKTNRQIEVKLSSVENGTTQVLATTKTGKSGTFGFLFVPPADGFYTIGVSPIDYPVYLKAGDKVSLDIKNKKATLDGDNTKENKALYKWWDASEAVRNNSIYFMAFRDLPTFTEFFPVLQKIADEVPAIKRSIKTGNAEFDNLLRTMIEYDLDHYFLSFLYLPRAKQPTEADRIPYYDEVLSDDKFSSDDVLKFPRGQNMLKTYLMYNRMENKKPVDNSTKSLGYDLDKIPNPTLKVEYLLSALQRLQTEGEYEKMIDEYGYLLTTKEQKNRAGSIAGTFRKADADAGASDNFAYPDINGKTVSLSNFKGEVVVAYIWKTGNSPSDKQMAVLKALEKKYKATFIGLSVDAEQDKMKWIEKIKTESIPGVQLFAGEDSKIKRNYKIQDSPRYVVFNKNGYILSDDAPRLGDPGLEKMIEMETKKK